MTADILQKNLIKEPKVMVRSSGINHGSITRFMSPGDLGQVVKPFVFLDEFAILDGTSTIFPMHPHSGIATLTLVLSGSVWINDTVGTSAVLTQGDIEWMRASGGAWHESAMRGSETLWGLQLWLALPPHLENEAPQSAHILGKSVPAVGPAKVLVGAYQGVRGPVPYSEGLNYLNVMLERHTAWEFVPPTGHSVAWIYVYKGQLKVGDEVFEKELVIFRNDELPINFVSDEPAAFVIGSAIPHNHELVMGPYSVHTSRQSLALGLTEIRRIGKVLRAGRGA